MHIMWILLAYLFLYIIRAVMGPSVWDRLMGMNLISTKIIVIIAVVASMHNTAYYLDFAIIYALFGFIGAIFVSLFLLNRTQGGGK